MDVTRLEAKLPALSTRTQNEQIVSRQSIASTSKLTMTTSSEQTGGGQSGTSAADTDPASGAGNSPAGASTVSYCGASQPRVAPEARPSSPFRPRAAARARHTRPPRRQRSPACKDDAGTGLVTNQACSSANLTPNGTYRAQMDLNLPGGGIRSTDLARITTTGTPTVWRSYGARAALPVSGTAPARAASAVSRAARGERLGAVTVGALPPIGSGDSMTAGFTGSMVTLDGFGAPCDVGSGISAGRRNGDAGGQHALLLERHRLQHASRSGSSAATTPLGSAVGAYRVAGFADVTVTMTGTVLVDPVTTVSRGSAPCQSSACTSTSTVGGVRVVGPVRHRRRADLARELMVTTDLGNTIAQTTYKAAPSA